MDYKNSKIYKIVDNTNGNIYIGSTTQPTLAKRLAQHRIDYKKQLNGGSNNLTSFKILENNDYSIFLLEEYPCETKDQLLARERYYIESNECVNKVIPTRNKNEIIEYKKEYREQNKDKMKEYNKEYREQNKDKLKEYYEQNKDKLKERKKEYYEQNKERKKKYNKEYREQNKDKIKEYKKKYREQNKNKND
jgi:hypothetical protein